MSEIKERPILFSGPMVRAILSGRKTQTRRIVKFPKWMADSDGGQAAEIPKQFDGYVDMVPVTKGHVESFCSCPHGYAGDRLYVRETTSISTDGIPLVRMPKEDPREKYPKIQCWYAADNDRPAWAETKWTPSLLQPRWASRMTLEITGVRVERLNEISEEDAIAEGVTGDGPVGNITAKTRSPFVYDFSNLWESINGTGSWDANPFVWVIEFKRLSISQTVDQKVDCGTKGAGEL